MDGSSNMELQHLQSPSIESKTTARKLPTRTYQLRALSRKTVSFQKRQWFVNICCLALCPFAMVAIAGIMGIIVRSIVNNANPIKEFVYCSNVPAMTSAGLPITNETILPITPASDVPMATGKDGGIVRNTNYINTQSSSGGFSVSETQTSCVFWFGHNYPIRAPYESNVNPNTTFRRDTTFKADPVGGWLSPQQLAFPTNLAQYQTFPWALFREASGVNVGSKDREAPLLSTDALTAFAATPASTARPGASGLLSLIDTDIYANITRDPSNPTFPFTASSFQALPYFTRVSSPTADDDIDDQLANYIRATLSAVALVNKTVIEHNDGSTTDRLQYYADVAAAVTSMPWGAVLFDTISPSNLSWAYTLQMGTDSRIQSAASYPSAGLRRLAQQTQLSTAFARSVTNSTGAATTTPPLVTHGFRILPLVATSELQIPIAAYSGNILFPFATSFLLPIFVIMLVREKEERIRVMMEMNGLSARAYYITHYVHFYLMYLINIIIFIIAGFIFRMEVFTQTDPGVYVILFFVWGHAQVALAFFFSAFFSRSRSALAIVFLLVLIGVILNSALQFVIPGNINVAYYIWPPFAFYRALSIINVAALSTNRVAYRVSDLRGSDSVLAAILFLTVETLVFLFFAYYLSQVLPTEFGTRRPWTFPFTALRARYRAWRHKSSSSSPAHIEAPSSISKNESEVAEGELAFEDADVKAERARVLAGDYPADSPLVVRQMRKIYPNGKLSVKDVTFATESNMIFGLLGPNGAGKTSLISMLTGLYPATGGEARLNGYDLRTDLSSIYLSVGVCPQHDILWGDLTVEEHLYFYARLKGIPAAQEAAVVADAIAGVSLQAFTRRLSRGLSGGEKRRLSIAISLMGNPGVVFLDEPTTGLDPEVKRLIWDIVNSARQGRTIILTTHSMEEAEVLCQRIGIMAKGTLRCIGDQLRLKSLYGNGFRLSISASKGSALDRAIHFTESLLPLGHFQRLDTFVTTVSYEFQAPEGYSMSELFEAIEANKSQYGIDDWGLSQTSLEEVFLRIIQDDDADAE